MLRNILNLIHPRDNIVSVCSAWARMSKLPLTRASISDYLTSHPDYPSLLSIRDLLEHYGLRTFVLRAGAEKFGEIPLPFITQITKGGESFFTLVGALGRSGVRYLEPLNRQWTTIPESNFLTRWSGIVLIAQLREDVASGEAGYAAKRKRELSNRAAGYILLAGIPVLFMLAMIGAAGRYPATVVLMAFTYTVLGLAGAALSSLLLWQELGGGATGVELFCKGKVTDCNAVLRSAGAKFLGLAWSTVGFVYFWGMTFGLIANGVVEQSALSIVSWFSILALPFTLYSILYQWRVIRRWCRLCLGVQAVLFLQGAIVIFSGWRPAGVRNPWALVSLRLGFGILIPLGFVLFVLPLVDRARGGMAAVKKLGRIKRDPMIYRVLMAGQELFDSDTEGLGLLLGSKNAGHTLIKVCNPYCKHCAAAHRLTMELLRKRADIRVRIIFTGIHEVSPVRHFLRLAENGDELLVIEALDGWYSGNRDYRQLANRYPESEEMLKRQETKIEAMRTWCKKMKIEFTPVYMVDGRRLPGLYGVGDLEWLIPRRDIQ